MAADLVPTLTGFGRALRDAGLSLGPGDTMVFCAAAAVLDPTDLVDLYWAGRTSLVARREDIATYDEVFRRYFLGEDGPAERVLEFVARTHAGLVDVPSTDPPPASTEDDTDQPEEERELGRAGSDVAVLRNKSFAACTPEELAAVRRLLARLRLTPPRRRTRRSRPARRGRRPDLRGTVRRSMRRQGELVELRWRRRRTRVRPLVLVLDVSGSMAEHSRALLQFAWSARRAAGPATSGPRKVHVYCFGTRLACLTVPLRHRSPDAALRNAGREVVDWEGGTRIGSSLDELVRTAGRRGLTRGAVVVICSDGLDRGDPAALAAAMERLSRQCHRIVWCHPGLVDGRAPRTVGMLAAEPWIDVLVPGRDLSSLTELADLLPRLG